MKPLIAAVVCVGLWQASQAQDSAPAPSASARLFIFRRHFAPLTKPKLFLDGKFIAKIESGSYFSIQVPPGTHRLISNPDFHANRSLSSDEEATDVIVKTSEMLCLETTFMDIRGFVKAAYFKEVPCSIARDHISELRPLKTKWISDDRVSTAAPRF